MIMPGKKVLVSGIQSSGKLHIGNYFGAIRQNIELGNSGDFDAYIFLADYHSMTSLTDGKERMANTFDAACTYLAFGLDPEKVTLFKQSDVPEVHELTWILNTVTPMPMLELAHAYKSKLVDLPILDRIVDTNDGDVSDYAKNLGTELRDKINVGLFDYPVLMASDILIYDGEVVPVGRDQEQHVEIAREVAGKYNRAYGNLLTLPQAFIKKDVATVPGIDGTKMSKSKNNHIPLFGTPEDTKKRIMSIVTDSARPEDKKNPDENNIYHIHKLFLTADEDVALRAKFENGGYGYKEAKEALLETFTTWIAPHKEKYEHFTAHPAVVHDILTSGGSKARARAQAKMAKIRVATGLAQ
jgi:tryptophanyl-tRNA synthetase